MLVPLVLSAWKVGPHNFTPLVVSENHGREDRSVLKKVLLILSHYVSLRPPPTPAIIPRGTRHEYPLLTIVIYRKCIINEPYFISISKFLEGPQACSKSADMRISRRENMSATHSGGRWRLYYSGREKGQALWKSIGLAITDIDNAARFEGIQIGFKRISSIVN